MDIEKDFNAILLRDCAAVTFESSNEQKLFDRLAPPFSRSGFGSEQWPFRLHNYDPDKYPLKRKVSDEVLGQIAARLSLVTGIDILDDAEKLVAEDIRQAAAKFFVELTAANLSSS